MIIKLKIIELETSISKNDYKGDKKALFPHETYQHF